MRKCVGANVPSRFIFGFVSVREPHDRGFNFKKCDTIPRSERECDGGGGGKKKANGIN